MLDLSLYLVASRGSLSDEKFLDVLEGAIKGGVSLIQLREKNLNARGFFALGLKAQKLCQKYKIPLITSDRIDLALALDADEVRLGQEDLPLQIVRKILGRDKIIGLSLKSLRQLEGIEGADYLGCGAIKKTPTRESSVLSLEPLSQIRQNSSLPVVAIGGIDEAVIKDLRGIKLGGVIVVRATMNAKNPHQAAKTLKKTVCENSSPKWSEI